MELQSNYYVSCFISFYSKNKRNTHKREIAIMSYESFSEHSFVSCSCSGSREGSECLQWSCCPGSVLSLPCVVHACSLLKKTSLLKSGLSLCSETVHHFVNVKEV